MRYYLQTKKEEGIGVLYCKVMKRKPAVNLQIRTGIKVDIKQWNRSQTSRKAEEAYKKTADGRKVHSLMLMVDEVLENLFSEFRPLPTKEEIKESIADIVQHDMRELQREERKKREEEEKFNKRIGNLMGNDVVSYMERKVDAMISGAVRSKHGRVYSKNTIKTYESTLHLLKRCFPSPIYFDDIDYNTILRFVKFLDGSTGCERYFDSSINVTLKIFKKIVSSAYKEGIHENRRAMDMFREFNRENLDTTSTDAYLTPEELQALYDMPIKNDLLSKVRDIFLVGCYTCQRVSDYLHIGKENFVTTPRGIKVIKIRQQKTKNVTVIPVLNDNLYKIMERYNYDMKNATKYGRLGTKTLTKPYFNAKIKVVMEELSKIVPSMRELKPYNPKMNDRRHMKEGKMELICENGVYYRYKYQMITSHTARRTGITNLYASGLFDIIQIMSISGHKTEQAFRAYIRLSEEDMAEKIVERLEASNAHLF